MLEQKFKPNKEKLGLTDIEIDLTQRSTDYPKENDAALSLLPHLFFNDFQIPYSAISKLTLTFNTFAPTLNVVFLDMTGYIHKYGLPGDDEKIKLLFPSTNKALGNIIMEFKIESFDAKNVTGGNDTNKQYNMVAVLNVNQLYLSEFKLYNDKTSYEVFEEFAKNSGLGFVSNVSNTNDRMNWTNINDINIKFLNEVKLSSWINENSFMWAYIDPFYNLVLCDVEKQLEDNLEDIVWSLDNIFSTEGMSEDDINTGPPVLTTDSHYMTTNIHVADYTIINNSTNISIKEGYNKNIQYYDIDGNWEDRAGYYYKYNLQSINTPHSENNSRLMKSYDDNFLKNNISTEYHGIIDTSNVHPDYMWARAQNKMNLSQLEKIILQLRIKKQNFNIKRFEKIQLHIVDNDNTSSSINGKFTNEQLSGNYICTGFYLEFDGDSITQYINLSKRELGIPTN